MNINLNEFDFNAINSKSGDASGEAYIRLIHSKNKETGQLEAKTVSLYIDNKMAHEIMERVGGDRVAVGITDDFRIALRRPISGYPSRRISKNGNQGSKHGIAIGGMKQVELFKKLFGDAVFMPLKQPKFEQSHLFEWFIVFEPEVR